MTKFIITAESGSDLPKELVERYGVRIIPMHVTMGDETRPDGTFPVEEVFDFYEKTGTLPKTAGSTPDDNAKCFRQIFEEYPDAHIIHIAYSAVTTVSFNAAKIAEDFENIHLVDSKNVTIGQTAIIKATAEYIENHQTQVLKMSLPLLKIFYERTRFIFLPNTLLYLSRWTRIKRLFMVLLLNIHPAIVIERWLHLVSGKNTAVTLTVALKK